MAATLKRRYAAKLIANLIGLAIGLVIAIVVPRGLGPEAYGNYNFLSTFFLSLMGFFTLNTESCFFVKLSQRPQESKMINFYLKFNFLAIIVLFIFILATQLLKVSGKIWIGQATTFIYMGAFGAVLVWLLQVMTYVVDAYALTVTSELMRIAQKVIGVILIMVLFVIGKITLLNYFVFTYIISAFLILAYVWLLARNGIRFVHDWKISSQQVRTYIHEFYKFSRPLFLVSLFGIIATLFERWLIQKEGGSAQQGFYGLSYQIGAICILFTSAMSSLMMREFAIAFQEHAIDKMAQMFRRYVPFLYTVAAYFACFVCIEAQKITYIFGGSKFENAVIPVMIMAFYPIHQTYGQLNSTIFLATGQTKIYSIISLIFYVIGLPVAYFFIISFEKFGLDSVATGMALKMIIIQFLAVNVQLFFHSRYLKLSFIKYFAHQIISVSFLLLVAILSNKIISLLPELDSNKLKSVIASGFIYSVMVLIAIILLPMIFGLHRNDIRFAFVEIKKRLNPEKFNLR